MLTLSLGQLTDNSKLSTTYISFSFFTNINTNSHKLAFGGERVARHNYHHTTAESFKKKEVNTS